MKSMNLNLHVIFVLWTLAESLHALVVFVLVPIARAMIPTIPLMKALDRSVETLGL